MSIEVADFRHVTGLQGVGLFKLWGWEQSAGKVRKATKRMSGSTHDQSLVMFVSTLNPDPKPSTLDLNSIRSERLVALWSRPDMLFSRD